MTVLYEFNFGKGEKEVIAHHFDFPNKEIFDEIRDTLRKAKSIYNPIKKYSQVDRENFYRKISDRKDILPKMINEENIYNGLNTYHSDVSWNTDWIKKYYTENYDVMGLLLKKGFRHSDIHFLSQFENNYGNLLFKVDLVNDKIRVIGVSPKIRKVKDIDYDEAIAAYCDFKKWTDYTILNKAEVNAFIADLKTNHNEFVMEEITLGTYKPFLNEYLHCINPKLVLSYSEMDKEYIKRAKKHNHGSWDYVDNIMNKLKEETLNNYEYKKHKKLTKIF